MYPDSPTVSVDGYAWSEIDWTVAGSRTQRFQSYDGIGDGYDNVRYYLTIQRKPLPYVRSIFFAPHMLLMTSLVLLWISDISFRVLYAAGQLTASLVFAACFYNIIPPSRAAPKFGRD